MMLRCGTPADLPAVLALVDGSADAPRWPPEAWVDLLREPALQAHPGDPLRLLLLVADADGSPCGLLAATALFEQTELEFVLVRSDIRRRGVGRALLEAWLVWADAGQASHARLEVRESNVAAQRLYQALGFQVHGRRASYYHHPAEDALLMRRQPG